ncbi:MAG: tripartite tricarboxylate transporter substrate binding protein [Betaproteobacteria bacterium]|nr:tripartite tricarboxylate transporter substrate binding protein [Betaproteobacteria bacterium]
MRKPGRSLLRLFSVIVACANLWFFDSLAQNYPVKPIRLVVGYATGGSTDVAARMVAQKLSEHLGQPVTVENRTGANGSIAVERVAKSPADGYTLLMATAGDAVVPVLRAKLPYDLERDLMPVSLVVTGPQVLVVHPSVPARNVKELIALARSQPGKLNYASSGVGGTPHLSGELFKLMAKVNIGHVPYKGGSESAVATASGQVDMLISGIASVLPLLGAGKLRALAVTSAKRASLMPSLPTIDESGLPGYNRAGVWVGVLAPAGVPKDIIVLLSALLGKLVNTPEMKEALFKQGLEPQTNTPEQFAAFIRSELAQNAKLIKASGLKVE